MSAVAAPQSIRALLGDLVSLTKPRVTALVLATAGVGLWLAPQRVSLWTALSMLVATTAIVGSANALNCWLERDIDRFMSRTKRRPLPAGRLDPQLALAFGLMLGVLSVPVLVFLVNPLTGLLGALALVSYVWVYTPLKQRSPKALLVGAVPGALPPLMGWTAATGSLDAPGIALFAVLFFWQLPHFIAISMYRQREYSNAGLKVLPAVRGERVAKLHAILYAAALMPATLWLVSLDVAGSVYLVSATVLGAVFLGATLLGLRRAAGNRWARRVFVVSLFYLPLLLAALVVDAV